MELACNLLVDDIRKNIDNGLLTGVIYLNLSKAFDTVSNSYLLSKLPTYGINGNEFTTFENYLFHRKQHVFYDGHLSKAFPVFRGVPQGSILGPTYFELHLDDIYNCLRHSSITKYADETAIYVTGNDSEPIQKKLNADILEVCNWLTDKSLSLNLKKGKTETMILGTSNRIKKAAPLNIQIKGTSVNQTSSYKYLGTHLDSTLALNGNFNSKYKKLSCRLRLQSKLRPDLNVKAAKMIYTNIVILVFKNCGTVNLNLSKTLLGKLDRIHEEAVGIITKTNTVKLTPIMTYEKRHACQIVRTSITRQLPVPMSNYFKLFHTQSSKSTTNNKLSIALPRVQNGFYYQGAMIYNSLTRDNRMQENENLFLKRLHNFNF